MKRITRTIVPFTLAGLLSVNGLLPAVADAAPNAASGQFKDVSANHWASQYILKMGLRDVVAGYNDGTFRPDESVTQLQALAMVVRNMGLTEEAKKYESTAIPYSVPDWAKGSVALAISKGLIKPTEKNFYPDMPASRAWVAQLMVRMIDKESEVGKASSTLFTDGSSIPDWAKGYVDVAVANDLISGYKEGAGTAFKPNRAVTRAEMVTMLSKGERFLKIESANTRIGYLQSVSGNTLTLTDESGKEQYRYTITSDTQFYNGNVKTTSANLGTDSQLLVISENGQARYVEVINFKQKSKYDKAVLEKVFIEANTVVLRLADGKLQTYTIAKDAVIGAGMDRLKLSDFVNGDEVEFRLNTDGQVSELFRTGLSKAQSLQGSVYDVDKQNKLLTIKASSGKLETYQYSDITYVEYKGKRFPSIEDLLPGDEVKLELTNGIVSKVVVEAEAGKTNGGDVGTVKAISDKDRFVTLQGEDGKIQAYTVAQNAIITLNGALAPTLADVKVGDKVEFKVQKDMITSLAVKNRTVYNNKDLLSGSIFALDKKNRILSLKTTNGELKAYEVVSNAEILINGSSKKELDALDKDMNVSIQLNEDNKIIYINADNRVRAEVVRVNTDDKLLTVKLATGETKVYVVDPKVDITIYDVRGEDLRDLRIGDKIAMKMNGNKITDIEVERSFVYRVTENGGTYSNRLTVQDENGRSHDVIIDSRVTFSIPGIPYPRVSDVKKGDVLRATYLGDDLKEIAIVPNVYGQVVSVSPEMGRIVVRDLNGVTSEVTAAYGTTIQIGDRQYTNINVLKPGDRVQVAEATNGAKSIVVLTKVETTFNSLDPLGDRIYTAKQSYYLPDSLFNRQVNLQSLLRGLRKGDNVAIYLLNNEVYEIEKVN
ncbi:S-layer homology domain-containing protein [Aneurinibacillus thermoaerophilus]|uniref:S-layer homology domain-containing protein n=1 Tax=Aneurinibacillus thermoaerophilus TaxID=143495 RepID=UPI002E20A777|nr:S-layer homology domain-containing protein [Aneurinibacillus thermoaerophilus]MED0763919.1 S-layer homology domain-containing protein [Aneurinibacillus thermoaerophilus]